MADPTARLREEACGVRGPVLLCQRDPGVGSCGSARRTSRIVSSTEYRPSKYRVRVPGRLLLRPVRYTTVAASSRAVLSSSDLREGTRCLQENLPEEIRHRRKEVYEDGIVERTLRQDRQLKNKRIDYDDRKR